MTATSAGPTHGNAPPRGTVTGTPTEVTAEQRLEAMFLNAADIIFFDRAVGAGILEFARREARKMLVAGDDDPSPLTGMLAKAGRRVVRLTRENAAAGRRPATS